ncbi:eukaryotic peptide chain release factor subunit 1 [Moniliophthora roreri MCA 2997]|uniref:Eukaryotic peptide chain release factor subunit 1 n=1 Tax=Moniliophthora roreri (strain MCA 2997) TaxID=1381753 RepID=V2XR92_MONRO|nr:eukaryotic peptide chain release factor subunit 1 [Moniliophthora roreri MCA 2997]
MSQEPNVVEQNIQTWKIKSLDSVRGGSLYLYDNRFHTEALSELLESDSKFGFIAMDGKGTLFGTLAGNPREVIHKFAVDLPKKHGRGGQSALRFSRLCEEKRYHYVRKVAKVAAQHFITNGRVNVTGFIQAGSADFKMEFGQSDILDQRLAPKITETVDVIDLAVDVLSNVNQDTSRYCFGINDTFKALVLSAVETLMEIIVYSHKEQEKNREKSIDQSTGQEMESTREPQPLLEWFMEKYRKFGANLEFVTNRSQEGSQFVRDLGDIGGLLRCNGRLSTMSSADE